MVRGNYKGFIPREVKEAWEVAKDKAMIGHPNKKMLKEAVSYGCL